MTKQKSRRTRVLDALYLSLTLLPLLAALVIKVLTAPLSEGISITGAQIYFTVPMPLQDLPVTEAQVNSALILLSILGLCLFLTNGLSVRAASWRQHAAEWIVIKVRGLVRENMGEYFAGYAPFIAAVLALSAFSSLSSLLGIYPPTSDLNIVAGWAILVFLLITYYKFKCGPLGYLRSFTQPVAFLTPMNVISEAATPLSMAFRHYGNVLAGTVISAMIAAALGKVSSLALGWLPGVLGEIPLLRIGLPAVLSVYFDVFSGCLQAYIFAMLTMMYVSGGFAMEEYFERRAKKEAKKKQKINQTQQTEVI